MKRIIVIGLIVGIVVCLLFATAFTLFSDMDTDGLGIIFLETTP